MGQQGDTSREVPYLRRYARALTGSQQKGDAFVAATIEALIAGGYGASAETQDRLGLYKTFHAIWSQTEGGQPLSPLDGKTPPTPDERLQALSPFAREALLLTTIEGFSTEDAAAILSRDPTEIEAHVNEALAVFEAQFPTRVLIIEDESLIALDLERIVSGLGHEVVGIATTKDDAIKLAKSERPALILADIRLADGSSGLDAVSDILKSFDVPVIFVTAFPERLLTAQRPEPAYLITKPFISDIVATTIRQALFFREPSEAT